MTPIDEHLYDSTPEPQGTTGVAAPPRPTEAPPLNVARMRQLLSEQSRHMADAIDPLQKKLDLKLHELDETLRPKLEQPVKEKPLLSVALSAGAGVLIGALGVMALVAGGRSQD